MAESLEAAAEAEVLAGCLTPCRLGPFQRMVFLLLCQAAAGRASGHLKPEAFQHTILMHGPFPLLILRLPRDLFHLRDRAAHLRLDLDPAGLARSVRLETIVLGRVDHSLSRVAMLQ